MADEGLAQSADGVSAAAETAELMNRFFNAVEAGDLAGVKETVDAHPDAVRWEKDGFPALYLVVPDTTKADEYMAIAEYLMAKGADLNKLQPIPGGCPMIAEAVTWGATDIAVKMINAGADLSWRQPPREIAVEEVPGATLLMYAAGWGNLKVAEALLDHGMDIDEKDDGGNTAVMCAARSGKPEMVDFLIARGADTRLANTSGDTLLAAAEKGLKGRAVPAVKAAFQRMADEAVKTILNGVARPVAVSRPLRFKPKAR